MTGQSNLGFPCYCFCYLVFFLILALTLRLCMFISSLVLYIINQAKMLIVRQVLVSMFLGTFLKSKKTLSFKDLKKQSINNDKAQKNKDTCIIKKSYFISFVLLFIFGANFLTTHTHTCRVTQESSSDYGHSKIIKC